MDKLRDSSLSDSFGRKFAYLRLSITEACNFRCVYCLPNGYKKPSHAESPLNLDEIKNLATAFAELGMTKIRLTGGEPTLRQDLTQIAAMLSSIPTIKKIALSTNGHNLKKIVPDLLRSGITSLNVSLDSLDPLRFQELTGSRGLLEILEGIEMALALGMPSVKVNAVLLKSGSASSDLPELDLFLNWIRTRPVCVRFIELMPTSQIGELFKKSHLRSESLKSHLLATGWTVKPRGPVDGPALEYSHPEYQGSLGIIAPYSNEFCQSCNRLRVNSLGALRLCLFAEGNHSLRPFLQSEGQKDELKNRIRTLLNKKEASHYLPEGRHGDNRTFSSIGG
jgi:cyclic pyranopterin phosphate synthase